MLNRFTYLPTLCILLLVLQLKSQTINITPVLIDTICPRDSVTLVAHVGGSGYGTNSYSFQVVPYHVEALVTDTAVDPDFGGNTDDAFSGPYPIGFEFCFLNQHYTQYWICTNGWISFSQPNPSWTNYTPDTLPNNGSSVPKNVIFGPWQDWWPHHTGVNNVFRHIISNPPDSSKLVVYWDNCPMYGCDGGGGPIGGMAPKGTFQIVLNQASSIIENNITRKDSCSFQSNSATQGVQNVDGTQAYIAFNRNQNSWTTYNESTRFVPSGVSWYKDVYPGGAMVGQGDSIVLMPTVTTTYYAVVNTCINGTALASRTINVFPENVPSISGSQVVCMDNIEKYQAPAGMTGYIWTVTNGTVVSGGAASDDSVMVRWDKPSPPYNVTVNYADHNGCRPLTPALLNVTVNQFVSPVITGLNAVCANSQATYSTQSGNSNYLWTYPGATLISGGTTNDSTITLSWPLANTYSISVNYTGPGGCTSNSPVSKTISVNPSPIPTITGSNNICLGSAGTIFTTDAGMTGYIWTVTPDGTIISGSGTNTVQITWPTTGIKTVSVNYVTPGGCTAALPTEFPVIVNPLPVPTITGNQNICEGTTNTVYTTQASMSNYSWIVSAGGTITAGGTTSDNSVTVTWNTAGAKTVSVNYADANNCTANAPAILPVTVHPLPVPSLAGPAAYCAGSAGAVYTTQAGMTNYQWAVSAGGTITAGGGSANNTITITWNTAGAHTVSVNYNDANGCTALLPVVYNVIVNPLPVPAVTGPASVCLNSSGTYSTAAGMTNYTWTVSAGGTITSGSGTNSIDVLWSSTGAKTITLNYTDVNGCTTPSATIYNVTVNLLPVPALAGLTQICIGNSTTYTTDAGMNNYSWIVSAGGSVTSGGGTTDNFITILWNAAGAQTVSVNYTMGSGCSSPSPSVLNVTVHPLPVPTITGTNTVCAGSTGIVYSTQAGMTNYQWVVSAGGTITAGGGPANNTITLTWNTAGAHTVNVNYNDVNGCTAPSPVTYNVTVNPLPVPSISGPVAVCLNTSSVYSTDSGMSNYTWSVSPGGTITAGTGTNSITVLWNTTGAKTITVNYSDLNNCNAASPSTYSVNVSTLPVPSLTGSTSVCKGNSVIYSTDAGMTGYSWTVSAGGIITAGGGPADNSATINWNTPGAQSVSVNYQAGPGCSAPTPTVLAINVKPRPAVTNAGNSSVCSSTTLNITLLADLPLTTFSWTATGSSGNVTGFNNSSGPSITDHLVNSGPNTENVTYAVVPSLNGCDGNIANFIVTVFPFADVTFTPNGQGFCSGGSTSIRLGSNVAGSSFTWTASGSSGNVSGFGPGSGDTISQILTNSGFLPETVNYLVQPSANGCPGGPETVIVTVSPVPSVAFTPCTDIVTTTDARPFTLKGGMPLGGTYSGTGVNTGIFYPSLAGTGTHNILYSYTTGNGCSASGSLNIMVSAPAVFSCNNMLTDIRDNAQYPTVKIGTQCWMAANLNFGNVIPSTSTQRDNCIIEKYCFNDNPANCTTSGGLYQWDEIMRFDVSPGIQGLCPPAWHIPTETDWTALFNFYTSNGFAGNPLKPTGYSGFNALLTGDEFLNRTYAYADFAGFFWSSASHGVYKAWAHGMNIYNPSVSYYPSGRSNAFSVRCIED